MTKLSWEQLKQWDQDDLINYIETLQDDCEQHIKNLKILTRETELLLQTINKNTLDTLTL
jgi:hypothetical protein